MVDTLPRDDETAAALIGQTFGLALDCRRSGRAAEAESLLRAILEVQPRHVGANFQLGQLCLELGRLEEALELLTQACALAPETGDHWLEVADCLLRLGRAAECLNVLNTAIAAGLSYPRADSLLAAAQQRLTPSPQVPDTPKPADGTVQINSPADLCALAKRSVQRAALRKQKRTLETPAQLAPLLHAGQWQALALAARDYLEKKPEHGTAWDLLGIGLLQTAAPESALIALTRASELMPQSAEAWDHLAMAQHACRQPEAAEKSFRRSLALNASRAETWANLGNLQLEQGKAATAVISLEKSVLLKPNLVSGHANLGNAYRSAGDARRAVASCRRALALQPNLAEAHNNLGNALGDLKQVDEALTAYRRALELQPNNAIFLASMGNVLNIAERYQEALPVLQRAVALQANFAEAHCNLGFALKHTDQVQAALVHLERALALNPHHPGHHGAMGDALQALGSNRAAIGHYQRAIELKPDMVSAHSTLLFALSHDEMADPREVAARHRAFGASLEASLRTNWPRHGNDPDPNRRLRVGFVSGDLNAHAVASYLEPVWRCLNPQQVEIFAYATRRREDDVTRHLQTLAHHWRQVAELGDSELGQQILADQIDILVDLSGHTGGQRLPVFARKPAPVQVSWIGYPNTTGLSAMDYYLADRYLAPVGELDELFSEKIVRLPCVATFQPALNAPDPGPLPALSKGHLTFGSFNRNNKLGEPVIALWSRVLQRLPDSRILLGGVSDPAAQARLAELLGRHGVSPDRLDFAPRLDTLPYLALHQGVDLLLDTFPYGGGTTTCHAAWMGVPILTLAGRTIPSRQGACLNSQMGLTGFVAESENEFVDLAVAWAGRLPELAAIRAGLRGQFAASRVNHPEQLARSLESALRTMWQRWCQGLAPESFEVAP